MASAAQSAVITTVVVEAPIGPGGRHGLAKLTAALEDRGVVVAQRNTLPSAATPNLIIVGQADGQDGPVQRIAQANAIVLPHDPEALVIKHTRWRDRPALLVCGADDRGLMYAALDVADRIGWTTDPTRPLREVRDAAEKPAVADRALSIYTMHQGHFESRFHDQRYWAKYFDLLAASRFNSFVLIFGYENWGYFAPPYPYLFDVEGFPGIRVVGLTEAKQRRNLAALNRMIDMAHARGLRFRVGIWDHIYRGGVQGPRARAEKPTPGIVWGLTADKLVPYSKAALAKFFRLVPNLDGIQFRMHGESGLKRSEMHGFWSDIYDIVKAHGRDIQFDARAKGFPDSLIDLAVEKNVPIRICTKYWMEQMGLPFHPTHIHPRNQHDRRHGYADLLRYPKRYEMHWRLWTGGTTRVLLWGDPQYVRRFAESTHLYGEGGFEVNEPLATKMQDQPHERTPFTLLNEKHRYYEWEFERYWHFFQVFGRVAYNPETPPEVWHHEFERRFGPQAGPRLEHALHRASQILPRIVAYTYPYNHFPTTRGWATRQRQEDLPTYSKALPSDTEQFLSPAEAARLHLEGKSSAKISPQQSSRWFAQASQDVLRDTRAAKERIGSDPNREFVSTVVDLEILAHLAAYHSSRVRAGLAWALFDQAGDAHSLDDAIAHEERAVAAWRRIVEAAGEVYNHDLMMGRRRADLSGHWKDELAKLEAGLAELRQTRRQFRPQTSQEAPTIAHVPVRTLRPGEDLTVRATIASTSERTTARIGLETGNGDVRFLSMKSGAPYRFQVRVPASDVTDGLRYFIEAVDPSGRRVRYPRAKPGDTVTVAVSADVDAPTVSHAPVTTAPADAPLTVRATVRDSSGVAWVRLRYRAVNQYEDFRTLPMRCAPDTDVYEVTVPAEHIDATWNFMYFIEVADTRGNGRIHPNLDVETPYVIVGLDRSRSSGPSASNGRSSPPGR